MAANCFGLRPAGELREPVRWPDPIYARLERADGDRPEFFEVRFGPSAAPDSNPRVITVPLQAVKGRECVESWSGPAASASESIDGVCTVTSTDYVVLHARVPADRADDVAASTEGLYGDLIGRARNLGYSRLLRTWNFVPDINHGDGDDETYVRFSRGRAVALDRLGIAPADYPAATAVGSPPDSPLSVIVLASCSEPLTIENPRQTSAYRYPRRYGPRSPAFARASLLRHSGGGTLFISGTASIVGHESRHDALGAQLAETLTNLEELLAVAEQCAPDLAVTMQRSWRVYLRHAGEAGLAEDAIAERLGSREQLLLLQAEICRRELQVEIEGVCQMVARATAGT
jgi:chorismate lyase/3-hydroxybenzoate synthase